MLQDIRKNTQGTAAKIVVGLIVVSFSIFGIESILLGGGGSGVAEVNGEEISPQELQLSVNTQKRRLIAMLGENLDPAMLDDQRLGAQALEALISRKLLTQSATDMKLAVSERQIGLLIGGMEQFQIDGRFSPETYKSMLSSAGYTPAYFKQNLREDMVLSQLRSGLAGTDFATETELDVNARITAELRDVRYLTIPKEKFIAGAEVVEEDIQAWYTQRQSEYQTTESLELDYIELNIDGFEQPVDEVAIQSAYELAIENGEYNDENRVSHILFERGEDETEPALQQRLAAAQQELAGGTEFAIVAGKYSDDIGSAVSGGDLGYSSGDAFPEEMEQAIADLAPQVVSEPVQTAAGTHLIVVTERREGKAPSLDELRPELEARIKREEARVELLLAVESLKDLAFNADDLDGPAAELDVALQRSEPVTRTQSEGLFASPSLLEAAFSDDVLQAGHNSDVIELGGDRFVVLRVHTHNAAETQPLEQVRDQIVAAITDNAAMAGVAAEAERLLRQLRAGAGVEQLASTEGYEWQVELAADRGNRALPGAVLQRAFELPAPAQGESATEFVMTPAGDALVFELVRVAAGEYQELAEVERQMLEQQVSTEYGNLVDSQYRRGLRDKADISVM